jgi:hypothetical protein
MGSYLHSIITMEVVYNTINKNVRGPIFALCNSYIKMMNGIPDNVGNRKTFYVKVSHMNTHKSF